MLAELEAEWNALSATTSDDVTSDTAPPPATLAVVPSLAVGVVPTGPKWINADTACSRDPSAPDYVPAGWTPGAWIERLEQMAGRCTSPERAGELRRWRDAVGASAEAVA